MADQKISIFALWNGQQVEQGASRAASAVAGIGSQILQLGAGVATFETLRRSVVGLGQSIAAEEQITARLSRTLSNMGRGMGDLDSQFTKLMRSSAFDDDEIASAFQNLVQGTQDYDGSLRNLRLVLDVAAAKQMDVASASQVVAQAMEGNVRQVGMLFPELRNLARSLEDVTDQGTRTQMILDALNKNVGGQAAAQLDTFAGSWANLTHEMSNFFQAYERKSGTMSGMAAFFRGLALEMSGEKLTSEVVDGRLRTVTAREIEERKAASAPFIGPQNDLGQVAWREAFAKTLQAFDGLNAALDARAAEIQEGRIDLSIPLSGISDPRAIIRQRSRQNMRGQYAPSRLDIGGKVDPITLPDDWGMQWEKKGQEMRGILQGHLTGAFRAAFKDADSLADYLGNALEEAAAKALAAGIIGLLPGGAGFIGGIAGALGLGGSSSSTASRAASANLSIRNARLA